KHETFDWNDWNIPAPPPRSLRESKAGYAVDSGIVHAELACFLRMLSHSPSLPLLDTNSVSLQPVVLSRDAMALKPGAQFDNASKTLVGASIRIDQAFVDAHPDPSPAFLSEILQTEAAELICTSMDGSNRMSARTT